MGRIAMRFMRRSARTVTAGILLLALAVLLVANQAITEAAFPDVSAGSASAAVGDTTSVPIVLSEAPSGLSGYRITVLLDNPSAAVIDSVSFPSFGITNANIPSGSVAMLTTADLSNIVNAGDTNITLANVDITAVGSGSAVISIIIDKMDDDSGFGFAPTTQSGTFTVLNGAPGVNIPSTALLNEGQSLVSNGTFTDPDSTSWSATVDYGDGSGSQSLALNGNQFSLNHAFSDEGIYSVTVTVTDDSNDVGVGVITVTVSNVAPVLQLPSNSAMDNVFAYQNSGSFSDPGNDTWSATVDYGDGSSVQPLALNGNDFTLDHVYTDYGIYQITITVSDNDGSSAVASFTVEIRHVCPTHTGLNGQSIDQDGDNKCEDLNGNGRLDFADVVYLFQHLIDLIAEGKTMHLDFNGNGILDMADIVDLFNMILLP